MIYSEMYKALRMNKNFYSTEGERNFIAQMLAMPESKVFLNDDEWENLSAKYDDKAVYPIDITKDSVYGNEWQDEQYIERLKQIYKILDDKIYSKSEKKETSLFDRFMDTCFYYRNNTLNNGVVEGIGFPIGINVDIKTHIWYLDFYNIDCNDIKKSIRAHARISRMEEIRKLNREDYGKEYSKLEEQLDEYLETRKADNKKEIEEEEELIENVIYGDAGNIVTENGRRPYKLCVYVRNIMSAPERAAATFARYKRKISIEKTDIFTGSIEDAFCFKIYYFEWERKDLLKSIIALGKYAYVKPQVDDEENQSFIAELLKVIRRCRETYGGRM